MTVSTTSNLAIAVGNGAATNFPYSFYVAQATDIEVRLYTIATGVVGDPLNASLYTVNGVGTDSGSIDYPLAGDPLAATQQIIIQRITPLTQLTNIRNQSGYYPATVEDQLDLIVMALQQIEAKVFGIGAFTFGAGVNAAAADNEKIMIELTDNTTITIKGKGSDDTIRTNTLTLT